MLSLALAAIVAGTPTEMRLLRNADIYGDTIVFNYASDLWVMDRKDGQARRLTSSLANETYARFSPDGKRIAFSGNYDGNVDVYVIDTDGGEPKRLTFNGSPDLVLDWTPDGKIAYRTPFNSPTQRTASLWIVDPKGGQGTKTV
ncbi:MAG: PD40 domain-containing protein, partial [Fimbriimonadaceae bacterium]|nr:PD40 domain-containing protein [Fimbriimonadaceae bacterium]